MLHGGPRNSSRSGLDAWLLLYPLPNIKFIYIYIGFAVIDLIS